MHHFMSDPACRRRRAAATRLLSAFLLAPVLLLACAPVSAAAVMNPAPFEARFEMKARGFVVADIEWRLERSKDGFVFESRSEAAGVAAFLSENTVRERSEWAAMKDGLQPVRYRYERTGRRVKSTRIDFDWAGGQVKVSSKGQASQYAIPAQTMDRLSYVLMLMQDMRVRVAKLHYPVATAKRLREFRLEPGPAQRLDTALGMMDAIPVTRERDDRSRETVIWLAPSLDFMPVRIDHRESDGEELLIRLLELRRGG